MIRLFRTLLDAGILTIGDKGVGRTQLSNVLSGNSFEPKTLYSLPQWIELFRFRSPLDDVTKSAIMIAPPYTSETPLQESILKNVHVILLLASYDNLESFQNLERKWIPLINENQALFQPTVQFIILFTKSDLRGTEDQKIPDEMISKFKPKKFKHYSVSSKTNSGIEELKKRLQKIIDKNARLPQPKNHGTSCNIL